MEKILNYNTDLYNFKKYFEHFFECDLEYIHKHYGSKDFEWDGPRDTSKQRNWRCSRIDF